MSEELCAIDQRRARVRFGPDGMPRGETIPSDLKLVVTPPGPDETQVAREKREDLDRAKSDLKMRKAALDRDLVALAISGGGIRSATFSLGVLQGLGRLNLLKRVDY